ncbi:MAG: C39 family peptidase [Patescibacteria group bacterium]|jgi:hypothetical protein
MKLTKPYLIYAVIALLVLAGAGLYFLKVIKPKSIPNSFVLQVPFSAQAPTDNWSRNEDCEETSLAMVDTFLKGNTQDNITASPAQTAIDNLKKWEQANLGYNADTGASATTKMAEGALGLKIKQIQDYTELDLKTELLKGHPILLPINAKLLNSPQYIEDGPTYHMIVIRGFRGHTFIVNDPGTNAGEANEYSFATLQKASADWDHVTKTMNAKRKIALVVSK